jgi:hypothetical protein
MSICCPSKRPMLKVGRALNNTGRMAEKGNAFARDF